MTSTRKCLLISLDKKHIKLNLDHQVPFTIGRSRETEIKDSRCSKKQVELTADCEDCSVKVKQTGSNSTKAGDQILKKGDKVIIHHKDIIETLVGQHKFQVEFDPLPEKKSSDSAADMPRKSKATTSDSSSKRKNYFEDFGVKEKKNKKSDGWYEVEDGQMLVYDTEDIKPSDKIASYDMDGTLILTKSGKVFAQDYNDWKIIFNEVQGKLKQLIKDGYKLVLFSNQAGITAGKQTPEGIMGKFDRIREALGVPMQMFLAAGKTKYRKPYTGMWSYMVEKCNEGVEVDLDNSVYVGDAAGRPEIPKKKKKDFSCSDRLFALNIAIAFQTPEEHFLGAKKESFNLPEFCSKNIDASQPLFDPPDTKIPKFPQEVVVLVGYPGSGKSFLSKTKFAEKGYIQVNRDTLGTWQKCVAVMEKSLDEGKNVVVDNTNPDVESRKRYTDAAAAKKVPVRCFVFNASKDHARHNNKFREFIGENHSKVSDMVFNTYKSKYQEPTKKEAFKEIVRVNFIPDFRDKSQENIYNMYLLEK